MSENQEPIIAKEILAEAFDNGFLEKMKNIVKIALDKNAFPEVEGEIVGYALQLTAHFTDLDKAETFEELNNQHKILLQMSPLIKNEEEKDEGDE